MSGNVRSAQPDEFGERVGQLHCQRSRLLSAANGSSLVLLRRHVTPVSTSRTRDFKFQAVELFFFQIAHWLNAG